MRFSFLFAAFFSLTFKFAFGQTYTLQSTIGGIGEKGKKIITDSRKYQLKGSSIFFLETNVGKTIVEIDKEGIIVNKYTFPVFSNAKGNDALKSINEFYVDSEDRILAYQDDDRIIYCFKKSGEKVYETKSINTYLPNTSEVSFMSDSKNNLYVGGANNISVLDKNGFFLKNIGKKGTANGEFNGQIEQLFIDKQDNVYALSQGIIQVFDSSGKFLYKFEIPYSEKLAFDGNNFYACSTNYTSLETLDKTGVVKSKLAIGNSSNKIYDVVGFIDGNVIIVKNKYSGSEYTVFDSAGKSLRKLNLDPYSEGIDALNDFVFDKKGNLYVADWYKIQSYDASLKNQSTFFEKGPIDFTDINQILSINDKRDILFFSNSNYGLNTSNLNDQLTPVKVNALDGKNSSNYIEIDSLKKEIKFLVSPFSGESYINVYDFNSKFLRKYGAYKKIMAIAKTKSNLYYLITSIDFDYKYTIKVLNNDGLEVASYKTEIGDFGDSVVGATFDENEILHIGVRHVYNGNGYSVYAFDSKGKFLKSLTNLSDNGGNFSSNSSFLLKYYEGNLFLGDYVNNQIFKLKFSLGNALLKPNIQIVNISKNINDSEFILSPTSSSKAPFEFSLFSGDAVSVSSDGKVKILKVGKALIKIKQAAIVGFEAEEKIVEITIKLLTPTIQPIVPISKLITDASFQIKPVSNSLGGFSFKIISGDAISIDNIGNVKIIKAGKAIVEVTQAATTQYSDLTFKVDIEIKKNTQTISFEKLPTEILSNQKTLNLKATASSGLSVTFSVLSGPATIKNDILSLAGTVGTIVVQANQAGSDKFEAISTNQSIKVILVLSSEMPDMDEVKLFPNPAFVSLYIETTKKFEKYYILNMEGKTIAVGNFSKEITIQNIPPGNYILSLQGIKQNVTKKFNKY